MDKIIICGIYKITSPSGRVYIGQSEDIKDRHYNYNSNNAKNQVKLQRSLVKYGFKNHIVDIVEECSKEDLNCRERYWQDFYDVTGRMGLNCMLQECGEKRREWSEESKEKLSKSISGAKHFRSIKVIDVKTLEVYPCQSKAAKALKIQSSLLGNYLNKKLPNKTTMVLYEDYLSGDNKLESYKDTRVIDIETGEIYKTISSAARAYNLNPSTLKEYLNERLFNKTSLMFLESYSKGEVINANRVVKQKRVINLKTGVVYNSINKASIENNLYRKTLTKMLKGFIKNTTNLQFYD